jgi:hypothetical protein
MLCSPVDAVIDSTQQIVNLTSANFAADVVQRHCATKSALWIFQPLSSPIDCAENFRGVLNDPPEAHQPVGFLGRETSFSPAPLQCRSRDRKLARQRLERLIDLVPQMFELAERQSFADMPDHFRGRDVLLRQHTFGTITDSRLFADTAPPGIPSFNRLTQLGKLYDSNGLVKQFKSYHGLRGFRRLLQLGR